MKKLESLNNEKFAKLAIYQTSNTATLLGGAECLTWRNEMATVNNECDTGCDKSYDNRANIQCL